MEKVPFDIDIVMHRVARAVRPYPKAALFELADDGFTSLFAQLVACIISIRTMDETTLVVARRLLKRAGTAEEMARLAPTQIETLIHGCSFSERKATQLYNIARKTMEQGGGELPCDRDLLLSFAGVGPKCANLALGIACGQPYIAVDVHVHRVTNRWGYVRTNSPELTMAVLEERLPRKYWLDINRFLVPFGKHICTGVKPHCSTCPVLEMCRQVGVSAHR